MGIIIKTFRDLIVWQLSHKLVLEVYKITKTFPPEEKFGLALQIRRSSSSVPTNIAEGHKRKSRKEYLHFLNVSESSLEETKYQLILSRDLCYISEKDFNRLFNLSEEIGRKLFFLQKSLNK